MQPMQRDATTRSRARIVLFGDSITQHSFNVGGWGQRMADYYVRRADVLNRGFSGYNTDWALYTLSEIFGENDATPALATIFFGANDACDPKVHPRQHVPVDRFKANLKKIVQHIQGTSKKGAPEPKIVVIAPPPVDVPRRLEFQKEKYGDKATGVAARSLELAKTYAEACVSVGSEMKIPVLNVCKLMIDKGDWKGYLNDGLHLSAEGNEFVFEALVALITKEYPDLRVTTNTKDGTKSCPALPKHFPWHDEIDYKDSSKAFGFK
mmetsp:Transcript_16470/g.32197  ORF Transcript_16470/g.32197 Transcript_16470/m.32197 type:complete len:266 (+) Transcript_16470:29-826(+)